MIHVEIKRIYEPASEQDGRRYLVDRLWPRGISKERAKLTGWLKDIAPSADLRKWYDHDPAKWTEFRSSYLAELEKNSAIVQLLREEAKKGPVTLVTAVKALELSNARVLKEFLYDREKT